jgi:hypothetical protein
MAKFPFSLFALVLDSCASGATQPHAHTHPSDFAITAALLHITVLIELYKYEML